MPICRTHLAWLIRFKCNIFHSFNMFTNFRDAKQTVIPLRLCLRTCCVPGKNEWHPNQSMEHVVHFYCENLSNLMDCAPSSAFMMILKNNGILKMQPEILKRNVTVLKTHFPSSVLYHHPELLTSSNVFLMEHRIQILKECGFSSLTLENVKGLRVFLKWTLKELRDNQMISEDSDPFEIMLQHLDCPAKVLEQIRASLSINYTECTDFGYLRSVILKNYLSWKFGVRKKEESSVHHRYSKYLSVHYVVQIIAILEKEFGFPVQRIHSFPKLLTLTPHQLHDILRKVPTLAGKDIKELVVEHPPLLFVPAENLMTTERLLKQYGISNAQMLASLAVFTLTPSQVQHYLKLLSTFNGYNTWKEMHGFLEILNASADQLKLLKEKDAKDSAASFSTLLFILEKIRRKKPACDHQITRSQIRDARAAILILCNILEKSEAAVKENLSQHPKVQTMSSKNARHVVQVVFEFGATKEQLWNGLPIVLYSQDAVREQLQQMPKCEEAQPFDYWKSHPNFLQLVIYCMEKQFGFSGSAVYFTSTSTESTHSEQCV